MRSLTMIVSIASLAACSGNPLDDFTRLSDLNIPDDAVSVAVVEAIADADAPLPDVAVDVVADAAPNPSVDQAAKPGFFAQLLSKPSVPTPEVPALPDDTFVPDGPTPELVGVTADLAAAAETTVPAPKQAGFFGRLFSGTLIAPAPVPDARLAAVVTSAPDAASAPSPAPGAGPDARFVTVGTQLPFGVIATNCDVTSRQLGTKVGQEAGYTLYDTIPNATALRTHYITGFKDRCARQFTAATSLMGDIGTHEVVRYLPSNNRIAYSVTDNAYEQVKAGFCGVGTRQPCGRKLDRLAKTTTFITAYRNFGSNPTWANILLHKGEVTAMGEASR
ncbi:MAG: hypothetical protein KC448_02775 [Yoonia sp.]|nr:hypothetical protein [Yoonia sp.]